MAHFEPGMAARHGEFVNLYFRFVATPQDDDIAIQRVSLAHRRASRVDMDEARLAERFLDPLGGCDPSFGYFFHFPPGGPGTNRCAQPAESLASAHLTLGHEIGP